jgi:gliding motility-associated-like protein
MADLDGDGDLDVVLGTQTAASVRLNQGNGTFAGGSELAITGGSEAYALGDVDGDGDVDLMTSSFSTGGIYTYLNQGNGRFGSPATYQLGKSPVGLALTDLDGDGDLDLLAGCAGINTVETRLNDGQGHFAATGSSVSVGNYPHYLKLVDLDSDSDLDLLTSNLYGGSVSVRFNTGGTFGGGTDVDLGKYSYSLTTGDVDGDNDIDFLTNITSTTGASFLSIGFNQGPSCMTADTTATLSPAGGIVLGCDQTPVGLSVAPVAGARYEWQYAPAAGAAWQMLLTASQPTYQPTQAGRYRARLTRGDCVALTAAVEVRAIIATTYVVPNIFTPNGDGLNEEFALRLSAPRTSEVQIFNRWGREVFHTSQYGEFWTGAGSPVGVYYYVWRYSTDCDATEHTVRGIVTLAR